MFGQQEQQLREKFAKAVADHFFIEDNEPALRPAETPSMMVGDAPRQYEAFQVLGIELANLIAAQGPENTSKDLLTVAQRLSSLSDDAWNTNRLCWAFRDVVEHVGISADGTPTIPRVYTNDSKNPLARMNLPRGTL